MAFIHKAVDPDALRAACGIPRATVITVWDADFPMEHGQQFIQATVATLDGDAERAFDLAADDCATLNDLIEQEAEAAGETVKFVLDLGAISSSEPCSMVYDGADPEDGDYYRCTVHGYLVLGEAPFCEGYTPPPYVPHDALDRLHTEEEWMAEHGGDLAGYTARLGDRCEDVYLADLAKLEAAREAVRERRP